MGLKGFLPSGKVMGGMRTDAEFKNRNKVLVELMNPRFLNNFFIPGLHASVLNLASMWRTKASSAGGRPFDTYWDMSRILLVGMIRLCFGEDGPKLTPPKLNDQPVIGEHGEAVFTDTLADDELFKTVNSLGWMVGVLGGTWFPRLRLWWIRLTPRYREVVATKERIMPPLIRQARLHAQSNREPEAGVDFLMQREQDVEESLKSGKRSTEAESNERITDEVSNWSPPSPQELLPIVTQYVHLTQLFAIIYASRTTVPIQQWILKHLTIRPDVQARLHASLSAAFPEATAPGRLPSLPEIQEMIMAGMGSTPYLDAVIEETLRLWAMPIARDATHDTEPLGCRIPKGTMVTLLSTGPSAG